MIEKIKHNPRLRRLTLWLLSPEKRPRPRLWLRLLRPWIHPSGKGAKVYRQARLDIFPWHRFRMDAEVQIESYAVINNGAGDVTIGEGTHVGIGSIIVGPVELGKHVFLGQQVSVQGINHGFEDINVDPNLQPLQIRPVKVGDYTHLGTGSVLVAGVTIGERCQIGAGSVVAKDIPPYSVAVGNPARVIKKYDFEQKAWIRVKHE